jgi:hypothetical protein
MELQLIQNKIYPIREQRVMLDHDLAEMYGIETRVLKQAVRRNIERFSGDDFMFQLTKKEIVELSRSQIASLNESKTTRAVLNEEVSRSHFVILNKGRGYNIKYAPFAFTELGVAMLSSVLNSKTAIEINRNIMRAFVALRYLALGYAELNTKLEKFMLETNMQFNEIYQAFSELIEQKKIEDKPRNPVGYLAPQYRDR